MEKIKQPKIRFKGFSEDWEECMLGDFLYEVSKRGNSDLEFITVREFDTILRPQSNQGYGNIVTDSKKLKAKIILNGQFLIDLTSYSRGIYLSRLDGLTSNTYSVLELSEFGNLEFFTEFLKHPLFVSKLESLTPIGVRQGKKIDQNALLKSKFRIPHKEEQEVIGNYFKESDIQINALEKKLEVTKQFKQTMLKKMFPKNGETKPEIRFKGFTEDWEECKLGDLIEEYSELQAQSTEYPLVSFTSENGVTPKTERYNREQLVVGEASSKKYKKTEYNDIVYNPANLKFGAIARNTYGKAVFSPIYVTFKVISNNVSPEFIESIVTRKDFINYSLKFEEGTVYERKSVKPKDFLNINCRIPSSIEQRMVGKYFEALNNQINALEQKLEKYKEFKKAMLQKMFI